METKTTAKSKQDTRLSDSLNLVLADAAGEVNDPESQDLMIGRITLHQKTTWMLKSFLKA